MDLPSPTLARNFLGSNEAFALFLTNELPAVGRGALSGALFRHRGGPLFCQPEFPQLCGLCAYSMTRGEVIRRSLSALCGRLCGQLWLLHLLELGFGLAARFRMLGQDGLLSGAFTISSARNWGRRLAGPFWAGPPAHIIATHARTALPE